MRFDRASGYSLYELLMTLLLISVIVGLGLPSLGRMVADSRLRAETDALFHAVHLARKESIVRRRIVTLCPSVDGLFCDTGNRWSEGWIMFANRSRTATGVRDVTEPILMQHTVDRTAKIMSNRKSYSFRSTDRRATNGTLIVCDRETRARSRALVVSYTGRPRVAYEDTRGRAYRCAD